MDLEKIFEDELKKYNDLNIYVRSLVDDFKDLYSQCEKNAAMIKSLVSSRSFDSDAVSNLLQKHIDIVSDINQLTKKISNLFNLTQERDHETYTQN